MPGKFINDDLKVVFASSEFGEADASYGGVTVMGIFDDEDIEVETGEGVTQIIPQPMFTGRTVDFSGIARDQTMTVRNETFRIKNWKVDGVGMIEIFLERT